MKTNESFDQRIIRLINKINFFANASDEYYENTKKKQSEREIRNNVPRFTCA